MRVAGAATLEAFSAALLALAALPASTRPPRIMDEGMAALRGLVPFDAAWWGESSGAIAGMAPRNWLDGRINLGAAFTREWNQLAASDTFALDSMRRTDVVLRQAGYDDPVPEVEAFARRHGLYHVMAVTRVLDNSGLLHFIVLYRHEGAPAFDDRCALLFDQFSRHLMLRWSQRIGELLAGGRPAGEAHALVDAEGQLVYLGARLGRLLHEQFPRWHGPALPAPWAAAVRRAPAQIVAGARRIGVEPRGDLVMLSLEPQRRRRSLPPREWSVARMYAEGRTHKQIAQATGLSPATVRTYLRNAYLQLGVSDKVALGRALR